MKGQKLHGRYTAIRINMDTLDVLFGVTQVSPISLLSQVFPATGSLQQTT